MDQLTLRRSSVEPPVCYLCALHVSDDPWQWYAHVPLSIIHLFETSLPASCVRTTLLYAWTRSYGTTRSNHTATTVVGHQVCARIRGNDTHTAYACECEQTNAQQLSFPLLPSVPIRFPNVIDPARVPLLWNESSIVVFLAGEQMVLLSFDVHAATNDSRVRCVDCVWGQGDVIGYGSDSIIVHLSSTEQTDGFTEQIVQTNASTRPIIISIRDNDIHADMEHLPAWLNTTLPCEHPVPQHNTPPFHTCVAEGPSLLLHTVSVRHQGRVLRLPLPPPRDSDAIGCFLDLPPHLAARLQL